MEKTRRSASYFNNAYQGDLTDQYNYQGQPFDQRIRPTQNSYKGQPWEQSTPSRQNSYQGEPADQRIPYRQNSQFDGVNQLTSDQRATRAQYLAQIPYPQGQGQYEEPQPYNGPGPQVYIVPVNGQAISPPGVQCMVRDETTPIPMPPVETQQRAIGCIITARVISALFILLDICLGWIQVASWVSGTDLPQWTEYLELLGSIKGNSLKVNCTQGSDALTKTYIAICAIATAYGLVRIVNMVGETLIEYNQQPPSNNQPPSKTQPRIRGFQIIHGWIETLLGMVCDDIPQVVLMLCFSIWCSLDYAVLIKAAVWVVIKDLKNNTRIGSCKQHYKPLCDSKGCCDDCCCVYSCNCVCCCTIFICRPCGCCCNKLCCETQSYEICPDLVCCKDIDKDPEWAKNLYLKLAELSTLVFIAMIIVTLFKMFPIASIRSSLPFL